MGLSTTVSDALDGGMSASRKLLVRLESDFEEDVQEITAVIPSRHLESSQVDAAIKQYIESKRINGYFIASPDNSPEQVGHLPEALDAFAGKPGFNNLIESRSVNTRPPHVSDLRDLSFFETEDKAVQLALWNPSGAADGGLLFYLKIDPDFLADAQKLFNGRQIFAQLRLAQGVLSESFFYPFIIVYGVILLLALGLLMALRWPVRLRCRRSE